MPDSLEKAADGPFTFTRFPQSQWRSIRTTQEIERLHEAVKRRIKTQIVLPSAETAAMLFWALLASGQIVMSKVDDWRSLAEMPSDQISPPIRSLTSPPDRVTSRRSETPNRIPTRIATRSRESGGNIVEVEARPLDPLMRSFALNVYEVLRGSNRSRTMLRLHGLSISPEKSGGFFVGLEEMHNRYYLSFGDLEETVENVRTAFGLFLLALSPLCRLRVQASRGTETWTLSEWAHGRERRVLAKSGYALHGKASVGDATWMNDMLSENECLRLQHMFRCEL